MSIRRKNPAENATASDGPGGIAEAGLDGGEATLRLRELENEAVVSRRGVLWRAGLATAAGAAALTALDEQRADAVTGSNFVVGQDNTEESATTLRATTGITQGFSVLMYLDGSSHVTVSTLDVTGPSGRTGVYGHVPDTGYGVYGAAGAGVGVGGAATSGVGVNASSVSGTALNVNGKVHFSRSGAASVAQGDKTKTVNVAGMKATSLVLVTLQVSVSGLYVAAAVPALGKFTVHLNKAAPTSMRFAWFALSG